MPPQLPSTLRIHHNLDPTAPKRRSLHATTAFPTPGTTIATFTNPLLALPDGPSMRTTCNYCLTTNPNSNPNPPSTSTTTSALTVTFPGAAAPALKACTACKAAVYCGAACQRAHWKAGHKGECGMFARVRAQAGRDWLPTPVRAVAQVLLLLRMLQLQSGGGGESAGEKSAGRVKEAFGFGAGAGADGEGGGGGGGGGEGEGVLLEGNVEGFRKDGEVWRDFELQAKGAVVYAGLEETEGMLERAREVLCKIQTNAFNRLDADTGMTGIFLDAGLAMVNHSCVPNAFIGFDKRTAVLRTERPIEEGEEITISYIDNTLPKSARHEALRLYHFECDCPRCKDDLDVYEVCRSSPDIRLNSFSLQPDLPKLRNPSINRSRVSKAETEAIYKKWKALGEPEGNDEEDHLKLAQARWEVCRPLVEADMWAVEPLPTTISQLAMRWQTSYKMVVYALPLLCFVSTECDPIKLVAPFMPWRIKGVMAIVMLLAVTGEFTASGELATRCTHEGLVGTLAMADQVSMCEALLRLAVHHGSIGASEDWGVLKEAKAMLADLESLQGREQESKLLRAWARDPEDPEGAAFFESQVLGPIKALSSFAVETLEAMLDGKSLVKR